jgi:uncharacterized protein YggE
VYQQYQRLSQNEVLHKEQLMRITGEGEIAVRPDTASINLGVITEGKKLLPAQQENSQDVTKVINSLISLGIPKRNLQTFDYRIESDYDYEQGKQIFRGYKITHILQVKMEDFSVIGKAVDTAVHNGANYVANVEFTLKNRVAAYKHALSNALINAIEKAKAIASSLQVTLIATPILIVEGAQDIHPYNQTGTLMKAMTSTQFEPGQLLIKANILAEFKYI